MQALLMPILSLPSLVGTWGLVKQIETTRAIIVPRLAVLQGPDRVQLSGKGEGHRGLEDDRGIGVEVAVPPMVPLPVPTTRRDPHKPTSMRDLTLREFRACHFLTSAAMAVDVEDSKPAAEENYRQLSALSSRAKKTPLPLYASLSEQGQAQT
jgi:hypothetical protein